MRVVVNVEVNGRRCSLSVPPHKTLAELLRDDLNLSGCRVACDGDVCGSCTVLVNGQPSAACSTFAFQVDGSRIETIEGLSDGRALHPIQQAFLETNAFQCGYCTAGFIMSVKALLATHPDPSDHTILEWLRPNVCRCTGYKTILAATRLVAQRMRPPA
jgi:aerobic carbon-monoxide dehydrogenase small subunit